VTSEVQSIIPLEARYSRSRRFILSENFNRQKFDRNLARHRVASQVPSSSMSSSSARTEDRRRIGGQTCARGKFAFGGVGRGVCRGICFETHPAGASRRYSGRYKPATKSSVCDTLIIGRIYGVRIVITDIRVHVRARSCRSAYAARICHCYIALIDIRRKCASGRVRMGARIHARMCIRMRMFARCERSCIHTRLESTYTRLLRGKMIVGR